MSVSALADPIARTPGPIPPVSEAALLVTHASRVFDEQGVISPELDRLVARFHEQGLPVLYLLNGGDPEDALWLTSDREPDIALSSRSGGHALAVDTPEITVAGGYFELCEAETVLDAASSYFARHPRAREFTAHYPLGATYSERFSYRDPRKLDSPIDELLAFGRPLTLAEALAVLGPERFLADIQTNLTLLAGHYRLRLSLEGARGLELGSRRSSRVIHLRFE